MQTIPTTKVEAEAVRPPARVPLEQDEPKTLVEMFERTVRLHNKPDALNYKRDDAWRSISSDQMLARARRIALGLYLLGLRHGDCAAILSENCPEWTLADAGCLFAGAIDVPIYPTLTPAQVRYILRDSGARALFIQNRAKFEQIKDVLKDCPSLEHVIFFDGSGAKDKGALTLAELEERGRVLSEERPSLSEELTGAVLPEDLATIIYTSGTTGEPKGVMLTHSNIVSNVIDCSDHLAFGESDTVLSVLPLSHVYERTGMYMYIHHGMSIYYAEAMDKIGDNLREVRPSVVLCVPRLLEKIYARVKERAAEAGRAKYALLMWAISVGKLYAQHTTNKQRVPPMLALKHKLASRLVFSKWRAALGGRIRVIASGGAALPEEIALIYIGALMPVIQGYGLTETSPVISAGMIEDNRVGTVGKPIRNVEVRIASDGEIEVRGPNVMRGYYNKPEDTRAVFTSDGWFKTGDIGALDADGFLKITDRKKELFKTSGGKYIAPQPIEQMIKNSRFVNQVVLIGNGRKFPAALIVPDFEQLRSYAELKALDARTPSELIRHPRIINLFERQVAAHTPALAQFERVKRIALLENELTIEGGELTPTLKVKRRVIDEKYRDLIDRLYAEAEKSQL
ncbi:MAG TPA: long-chain fatty acid--CoA ligase [Pyrinomonadaceae bacterium]|nr:long-chain fatty acid--CoA ligase [Pyrinomonadaceae bacterium]